MVLSQLMSVNSWNKQKILKTVASDSKKTPNGTETWRADMQSMGGGRTRRLRASHSQKDTAASQPSTAPSSCAVVMSIAYQIV